MEKVKIFGLGGIDETGKNTYVVELNNDIFVFDCGLKYTEGNPYGIDYVIPDYEYLVKNKNRIKGVFITHGHYENMGAALDLLKTIPSIKFYATNYTKFVLEDLGVKKESIVEIVPGKKLTFGKTTMYSLPVSHSVPGAVMFILETEHGSICYTGDFVIDPLMSGAYDMDLGKIAYIGKKNVLCLLSESSFSERPGHTSPNHRLKDFFTDIIHEEKGRLLFSVLPTHIYTIQDIMNAARGTHRKVVIMGKRLQSFINFTKQNKYLDIEEDLLGDLSNINDPDAILLICDDKSNPYQAINKIMNGYDKFITLKEGDTVVFAEPRYDSNEKAIVRLQNDLAMAGAKIVNIPSDKDILLHASQEDLMLMIKLLNPKYYMPVKGEYRYLVNNANIAYALGMKKENIFLKQNGDVVELNDGVFKDKGEHIQIKESLIDGKSSDDIGDLVIKDREMLSDNGIVLITATVSKSTHEIVAGPEITTKGFIYVKDSKEIIKGMQEISKEIIEDNIVDGKIDYNEIKTEIRASLGKYLFDETECKPMIIAVVQEV